MLLQSLAIGKKMISNCDLVKNEALWNDTKGDDVVAIPEEMLMKLKTDLFLLRRFIDDDDGWKIHGR
jgi:hypothetical protein